MKHAPQPAVSAPERVGDFDGRPLLLAPLRELGDWPGWPKNSGGFRVVFLFDSKSLGDMKAFRGLACGALDAGAGAIVCAGSAADAMQELIDEEIVGSAEDDDEEPAVSTAGCAPDEPLEETLWLAFQMETTRGAGRREAPVVVAMLENDPRRRDLPAALRRMADNVASGRAPGD